MANTKTYTRKIVSPKGIAYYPNLDKPDDGMSFTKDPQQAKPKYGTNLLLPKRNDDGSENTEVSEFVANLNKLVDEVQADAGIEHISTKKHPLKDGDAMETDDNGNETPVRKGKFKGFWYMNLSQEAKNGAIPVVDGNNQLITEGDKMPKNGDEIRASIIIKNYEVAGNEGITIKPKGIKLTARGVMARKEALQDFSDFDDSEGWNESVGSSGGDNPESDDDQF